MTGVFDLSKPGVGVMRAPMGGGWAWPLDDAGKLALREFFGEKPSTIPVLVGEGVALLRYIVEPQQTADLAEHLRSCNVAWEVK